MTKSVRKKKVLISLGAIVLLFALCALTGVGCVSTANLALLLSASLRISTGRV
ncbi:MAG: hypothetical protein ACI9X0_001610 [Kiritimatiellia bacterium]|jgi:hypothetical protein